MAATGLTACGSTIQKESAAPEEEETSRVSQDEQGKYTEINLQAYVEDLLGINLAGCLIQESEYCTILNYGSSSEEICYISYTLDEEELDNLKKQLIDKCGKAISPDEYAVPSYGGSDLAAELKSQQLEEVHVCFVQGEDGVKTRDVSTYITLDDSGVHHIYFMG